MEEEGLNWHLRWSRLSNTVAKFHRESEWGVWMIANGCGTECSGTLVWVWCCFFLLIDISMLFCIRKWREIFNVELYLFLEKMYHWVGRFGLSSTVNARSNSSSSLMHPYVCCYMASVKSKYIYRQSVFRAVFFGTTL
jgi:hypothetical protein